MRFVEQRPLVGIGLQQAVQVQTEQRVVAAQTGKQRPSLSHRAVESLIENGADLAPPFRGEARHDVSPKLLYVAMGVPLLRAVVLTAVIAATAAAQSSHTLTAAEAKNHLGETATVCGKVATARYAASARGQPTFLNLDEPYPKQIFTVLIWREQRARFGVPEEFFRNKVICVSGRITSYRGDPQIEVTDATQIVVKR
jgi:hypothetical protein